MIEHPLDNAVWTALTGPHVGLAERHGRAARYRPDTAPFVAVARPADEATWADLAALVGPGQVAVLTGPPAPPPPDWDVVARIDGVQMDGSGLRVRTDPGTVRLGPSDVPEMLDLVDRTQPGPFRPCTHEMGTYLGVRSGGALVAMAGERTRPPGWSEISAVCTDPAFRGRGLASRLVRAVGAVIRERGDIPFLHAAAANTHAIGLYEHLGFTVRRHTTFAAIRSPEKPGTLAPE